MKQAWKHTIDNIEHDVTIGDTIIHSGVDAAQTSSSTGHRNIKSTGNHGSSQGRIELINKHIVVHEGHHGSKYYFLTHGVDFFNPIPINR